MDFMALTPAGFLTTLGSGLFVMSVLFAVWLIATAFKTNLAWGFGCLLAPCLFPVFAIRHWRSFGNPPLFMAGVTAVLMLFTMHYVAPKHVPWYSGMPEDERIERNIQILKVAAEAYAADHDGVYPDKMDSVFKSYFPDGDCGKGKKPGTPLLNPYSEKGEWPTLGRTLTISEANGKLTAGDMPRGVIVYSPVYDSRNRCSGFAVSSRGRNGRQTFYLTAGGTKTDISDRQTKAFRSGRIYLIRAGDTNAGVDCETGHASG